MTTYLSYILNHISIYLLHLLSTTPNMNVEPMYLAHMTKQTNWIHTYSLSINHISAKDTRLVHAGIGEEQRGVIVRDYRRRVHVGVALLLSEVVDVGITDIGSRLQFKHGDRLKARAGMDRTVESVR